MISHFNDSNIQLDTLNGIEIIFLQIRGLQAFYSMSYLYFGAFATSAVVFVGVIVSYVTGK